jgi:hypothetical protein
MRRRVTLSLLAFTLLVPPLGTGCNKGKDPDNPRIVGPVDTSVGPMGAGAGPAKGGPAKSGGNKSIAQ